MNKEKLIGFIDRYSLGGNIKSVKIVSNSKDNTISTECRTEDKHVITYVTLKGCNIGDCEFGVFDTKKLSTLLNVLGDEITVTPQSYNSKYTSIGLSDGHTKVSYVLSDLSAIPKQPNRATPPVWDIEIPISFEFASNFIKCKSALPEVDSVTIMTNLKTQKLDMVLGYSSVNTNRISLEINPTKTAAMPEPINFSAKLLKEILNQNSEKDMNTVLYICSRGLAYLKFVTEDYTTEYYLQKTFQND